MAQHVTVIFAPTEYKYHYDCIRIKSDDQSYVVPLHGYPVINKIDFPRVIKFKDAPLCETVVRVSGVLSLYALSMYSFSLCSSSE
jgi:hypothetical protein